MDKIEDRIIAHLQGDETAEEARELSEWIRDRPENAKLFAEMALMHGQLRGLLSGEAKARKNGVIPESAGVVDLVRGPSNTEFLARSTTAIPSAIVPTFLQRRSILKSTFILAAMAACLLIAVGVAVGVAVLSDGDGDRIAGVTQANPKVIATLMQSSNAVWEGDSLDEGIPIHPQTLSLRSGLVRLEFVDGVEVTLQGPAEYEVMDVGRTRLLSGLLTAIVPPGAEGFQVDTPTAEVIDLGTAFGIELDDDGIANVSVFDGEVEVRPTNNLQRRLVHEGEAVRITNSNEIEPSEFDAAAFKKVWPVSSGIVRSTGAFRFSPQWPRRLRFVQSDSDIFVLPEGYVQTLDQPINVNVTVPGVYRTQADLTARELPVGRRVKCFLLQFNPVEQSNGKRRPPSNRPNPADLNPDDLKRIVGEITFDRPVLGLIVRGDDLRASDGRFSERGGRVPQKGRALELFGTPRDDVITLSEDRHTVKLDLAAFGIFGDHVRVIVDQPLVEYENQGM